MMSKEEFNKVSKIIKSGKPNDLKRVKKETLLSYIESMGDIYKDQLEEINTKLLDLDSRQKTQDELDDCNKKLEETLSEYRSLVEELRDKLNQKNQEIKDLDYANLEYHKLSTNRLYTIWVILVLFIISGIINIVTFI